MGDIVLSPFRGHKRKQGSVYCIEGENVSMMQIAQRLGVTDATARGRMNKIKQQPGAITWQRLRDMGR